MRLDHNAEICKDELSSCLDPHSVPSTLYKAEKISLLPLSPQNAKSRVRSQRKRPAEPDFSLDVLSIGHETRSPLTPMDTNSDHVNVNQGSGPASESNDSIGSNQVFPVGAYVMAAWHNNFEYLAEVISHRKRVGSSTEYKLRFVWDHVIEWYSHQKVREATKYEIDYVLQLCKAHGGPGCGRLLDDNLSLVPKQPRSRQRQQSGASEKSSSTLSIDQSVPRSSARKRRSTAKSEQRNSSALLNDSSDGMMYEKSAARFSEACKRRRQLKREVTTPAEPPAKAAKRNAISHQQQHHHQFSPHHSPLSKSSLDLCASVSPKSTDTPDSVDFNSLPGASHYSKNSSPVCLEVVQEDVKNYPCPYCARVLRNFKLLRAHLTNYHPDKKGSDEASSRKRNLSTTSDIKHSNPVSPVIDKSFPLLSKVESTAFVSGLLKCSGCHQRLVSHKIDPKSVHVRCDTCLCWSHRPCVLNEAGIVPPRFQCKPCAQRVSVEGRYCNLGWANLDSPVHDAAPFMPPTPPSTPPLSTSDDKPHPEAAITPPLTKRQVMFELMSIMNTASELEPLLHAARLQINSLRPPVAAAARPSPTDEKLNQILSAFEDLCAAPANDGSGILQDLGPEILPELLPPGVDSLTDDDFFHTDLDVLDSIQKNTFSSPSKSVPAPSKDPSELKVDSEGSLNDAPPKSDANNNQNHSDKSQPASAQPPQLGEKQQHKLVVEAEHSATQLLIEAVAAQHFQEAPSSKSMQETDWSAHNNVVEYNQSAAVDDLIWPSQGAVTPEKQAQSPSDAESVRDTCLRVEEKLLKPVNCVLDSVTELLAQLEQHVCNLEETQLNPATPQQQLNFKLAPEALDHEADECVGGADQFVSRPVASLARSLSKFGLKRTRAASNTLFSLGLATRNHLWQRYRKM